MNIRKKQIKKPAGMPEHSSSGKARKPASRKLRAYAFDPSLSLRTETAGINHLTYLISWEDLNPGPIGEYVEVIDFDPTINRYIKPLDLNHEYILAQDGLEPNEGNPLFHQQMVYAVTMTTIQNFEKALGRKVIWAPRRTESKSFEEYVQKLRIYPHALREANAYYSPSKKALLFGYFSAVPANNVIHMPDSLVYTCLSHDIIAHETTHAILDGMHNYYNEPSNPDVLAFHEAFADIVALFQHFSFPDVLTHQIAQTRGNLASQNLLGKLAQEFGAAIGSYGSLRDAIGEIDEKTKQWKAKEPDPEEYQTKLKPHDRGSILVAAVFEAFITIYKDRVAAILRLASGGSGILPEGELHPEVVKRLAEEASTSAKHVLNMCIRALDYCPPVDITFGEYLRAIITADYDLAKEDRLNYRLAFIDAFRRRGIYAAGIKSLSVESLRYPPVPLNEPKTNDLFKIIGDFLTEYRNEILYHDNRKDIYNISRKYIGGGLHQRLSSGFGDSIDFELMTGICFSMNKFDRLGIRSSDMTREYKGPSFRLQNLRVVSRTGPHDNQINHIVFSLVQRAGVIVDDKEITTYIPDDKKEPPKNGFEFWGGCTMIFDLDNLRLRYAITKPLLDPDQLRQNKRKLNSDRILKQYKYQEEDGLLSLSEQSLYFGGGLRSYFNEPFAFLHTH